MEKRPPKLLIDGIGGQISIYYIVRRAVQLQGGSFK